MSGGREQALRTREKAFRRFVQRAYFRVLMTGKMAWIMDEEIRRFVLEAEAKAGEILGQNRESLEKLAQALLAEEVLDEARIAAVVGHPRR